MTYYLVPYLLDTYDYRRRFSGPWLAAFTNWWYSSVVKAGHHSEDIRKLHEKYGTFVRIGPNHISIADPNALEAVYGHGSGLLKTDFYHMFQTGRADLFSTQDKAEHSKKRKRIANIFSQQNVLVFEPRVRSHIRETIAQLDMRCKAASQGVSGFNWAANNGMAVMNCCPQFSYLIFDIIGDLALGSPFGLVRAQKDAAPIIQSIDASGNPEKKAMDIEVVSNIARGQRLIASGGVYPQWAHSLLRLLPWNIPAALDQRDFFALTVAAVEARLKRGPNEQLESGKKSIDLIDKLLEVRNEDGSLLSKGEVYAEAMLLLIAGSDTTANSLSALSYHLATHPEVQRKLQAELDLHIPIESSQETEDEADTLLPPSDGVVEYEKIKNLPYLNACVKEALRLHSTVGTGLPRVVPSGKTFSFGGETFKAGSIISVPSFTTNRSSVWGSDAEEFRPERWLEEGSGSFNKYFVPFSVGPRACVGRNLATMDMMLVAATIFRRYEFEALPTTKLVCHEAFVREASRCEVAIKRRNMGH